jgi:hypothetical protein
MTPYAMTQDANGRLPQNMGIDHLWQWRGVANMVIAHNYSGGHHRLRFPSSQTLLPIIRNGTVDDSAAIDAFPCIEN